MSDHTDNRPTDLPLQIMDVISEFTVEELSMLHIYFSMETGEFVGIHFIGPGGKICRWADPRRARLLQIMDDQVRSELETLHVR